MAGGQDERINHNVAEVTGNQRGVATTIGRALRWLGTQGLPERASHVLRTVAMLIDDALRGAAAVGVAGRLVEQDLVRQVRAKDGTSTWREDEQGRALDLKILEAGCTATPADPQATSPQVQVDATAPALQDVSREVEASFAGMAQQPAAADPAANTSMRALVIDVLRHNEGTMINDMITFNGLLEHHERGVERLALGWRSHRWHQHAAANGGHLRGHRDHDESGGVSIMAAAPKHADAGVSPSIFRCPPCSDASVPARSALI